MEAFLRPMKSLKSTYDARKLLMNKIGSKTMLGLRRLLLAWRQRGLMATNHQKLLAWVRKYCQKRRWGNA
jgi:hypothetical protein